MHCIFSGMTTLFSLAILSLPIGQFFYCLRCNQTAVQNMIRKQLANSLESDFLNPNLLLSSIFTILEKSTNSLVYQPAQLWNTRPLISP